MNYELENSYLIFSSGANLLKASEIQELFLFFNNNVSALDGGVNRLYENGLLPKYVFGDLDSTNFREEIDGMDVFKVKDDQNVTDLDFAILYLKRRNYKNLFLYSERIGRVDHFYYNLIKLRTIEELKVIFGKHYEIIKIEDEFKKKFKKGEKISFFNLSGETKLEIEGVRWEFDKLDDDVSSISNETVGKTLKIKVTEGPGLIMIKDYYENSQLLGFEEKILHDLFLKYN